MGPSERRAGAPVGTWGTTQVLQYVYDVYYYGKKLECTVYSILYVLE